MADLLSLFGDRASEIGRLGKARTMASYPKHVNHELSPMACPVDVDDVDLFGDGGQEHWYEAYEILHRDAPVLRIEGGGSRRGPTRSSSPNIPTSASWTATSSASPA